MNQTPSRDKTHTNFANWPELHKRLFFLGMWNTHIGTCVFVKRLKIFNYNARLFSVLRIVDVVKCVEYYPVSSLLKFRFQ